MSFNSLPFGKRVPSGGWVAFGKWVLGVVVASAFFLGMTPAEAGAGETTVAEAGVVREAGAAEAVASRSAAADEAGVTEAVASEAAGPVERNSIVLTQWEFRKDHDVQATAGWSSVTIPHDWAIYGPFDRANDLQEVAIVQNGEQTASVKTGRTGGLPYMGKGSYRRTIDIDADILSEGGKYILLFDGAMSEARVLVNGQEACFWPYGYNSFHCDITPYVHPGSNLLAVCLENRPQSSRWYPGAGLYRKVRLLTLPAVHVPVWGTYITTPYVGTDYACVSVRTEVEGLQEGEAVTLRTTIYDPDGKTVAVKTDTRKNVAGMPFEQQLTVDSPLLWSPESPSLYTARTEILRGGSIETDWSGRHEIIVTDGDSTADCVTTRFGIRSIEIRPGKGFFLNGEPRKFQGVCLHHDLGPLGAAINRSAIRHQLTMLKDMGCDAVRTSHNMPAEELVELCDEMGFMLMCENFDEWDVAKCDNGYHRFFNDWAEKDMVNMLKHFRNHPSIVMWSIGNEVPSQWAEGGRETASFLQDICHRLDPTRPVTCGMDQYDAVLGNGFAAILDVAGFNYKVGRYTEAYKLLPQAIVLGSETASTVSSRGVYHFADKAKAPDSADKADADNTGSGDYSGIPVVIGADILHEDHHSSSYDVEFCSWSNIPDDDFAADEDYQWVIGQFLWTGFDYLGEPSPYDTDAWPNHSSMFGAIDLASIPKDRFYLYRSIWNEDEPTLHILPHWNWDGSNGSENRTGKVTPVFVYTSYPEAELFVNGRSYGRKAKADGYYGIRSKGQGGEDAWNVISRFRLMWTDVVYEPGELKVVAYDQEGNAVAEKVVRTAGKAHALKVVPDKWNPSGNAVCQEAVSPSGNENCSGEDNLLFLNVSVVDKDGNPVPTDGRTVNVKVSGGGSFKAMANGDPTSLELFHEPHMKLFSGQLTVIVSKDSASGEPLTVTVSGKGLKKATLTL